MNLTLDQVAAWLPGARRVGPATAPSIARVHTDTRSLQPGDLFVALHGENFDAAEFLGQAAQQGAAAAVCGLAAEQRLIGSDLPGLLVPDARVALGTLAGAWRQRFAGPLVAVTGSNGKTTVTQMIAAILHAWQGDAALATHGNFNNDIGVPLTLLRLRPEHRAAVVELGMNHPGEIARLAAMAQPTVALINNAQREHQEFMASVEAAARENGAVLAELTRNGRAVLPADDAWTPLWRTLAGQHEVVTFSAAAEGAAAVVFKQAVWTVDRWHVSAATPLGALDFDLHMPGRHNLHNAAAALASALAAGAPLEAFGQGLEAFRAVSGRSRILPLRHGARRITLIDDTYNANPDSVRALIDVLADMPEPRVLVLGDMGEVGARGPEFHAEVGAYARQRGIQHLLAFGPLSIHAAMAAGGQHFGDLDALVAAVRAHLPRCATLAVKGSRFMRMERVVAALTAVEPDGERGQHAA
jgi:UDP-N-acetylmuramoyl-tripeptide--D-alanyl-D-alanine ligase